MFSQELVREVLSTVFTFQNIGGMSLGIFVGTILGAIPGLTSTMGIALAVSFTYGINPATAIMVLMGAYKGGIWGGSIAAVLAGTPGAPGSAATVADGFALAQKGQGRKALKMALYSSVVADLFSDFVLLFLAAPLSAIALYFGPPELFALVLFSLMMVGSAPTIRPTTKRLGLTKGVIAGFIGLMLATVGLEPFSGTPRFIFGTYHLYEGINLTALLIGLLSMSELITQITRRQNLGTMEAVYLPPPASKADSRVSLREFASRWKILLSGAIGGTAIGIIPGIGPTVGAFVGYDCAQKFSKEKEKLGHGSLDGIAGAEAGNSAVSGANLIPLLALGVPGDVCAAILAGVFLIHGVPIGPGLVQKEPVLVYSIIFGLITANFLNLIIGYVLIYTFSFIVRFKGVYLFPVLMFLCIVGAYSRTRNLFDVGVVIVFGFVGVLLRRLNIPLAALVIGFILGPMCELSLYQSLVISRGSPLIFFQRPIALVFVVLTIIFAVSRILSAKGEKIQT